MKKIVLILIICLLFLIRIAYSSLIEVGINETIKGNVSSITYDNNSNIVKFSIEFYNTGSVGYKDRIKIEIFDNEDLIFSGWSQEKDLMPGERKSFDIYWYNNKTGKYFAKLKSYFGNEILEYKEFEFSIGRSTKPEDNFEIKNFRTYDNFIIFDVDSKEDSHDVVIIPQQYTSGWIFEQKEIGNLTKNGSKLVVMNYYPSLWTPSNVSLAIVSDGGKYYTEGTLEMKKNEGLTGAFFYVVDRLRIAFFS
jgi:hypothetical protein